MDYYEDPYMSEVFRYATNRYPYIEVECDGKIFHGHAHGWKGGRVMIVKPAG